MEKEKTIYDVVVELHDNMFPVTREIVDGCFDKTLWNKKRIESWENGGLERGLLRAKRRYVLSKSFNRIQALKSRWSEFVGEDGSKTNRILLSFLTSPKVNKWMEEHGFIEILYRITMSSLFHFCNQMVVKYSQYNKYRINIMDHTYYSDIYMSDDYNGLCVDGDTSCYRYRNMNRDGKVYKMKIGKLYKNILEENSFSRILPEKVKIYLCEEITSEWMAYSANKSKPLKLVVNDDFGRIYDSDELVGDFHSCMVDQDYHNFYENAVKAKAAYLEDGTGGIVARCIIYTEVFTEDGNSLRLAERQYSTGGDDTLKTQLVYKLIEGGYIDGYKKVGADCNSPNAWLKNDGSPFENPKFHIKCYLGFNEDLSYQDSFKWYDMDDNIAYNYDEAEFVYRLDSTTGYLEADWDEYHGRDCREAVSVWYNGHWISCDSDDLEDFTCIYDRYYHNDDVAKCHHCGGYFVIGDYDSCYSDVTDEGYCCHSCMLDAEYEYKSEHWTWSEYDEEYYENVDDVTNYNQWDDGSEEYRNVTISVASLNGLNQRGDVVEHDGEYYDRPEHLIGEAE